MIAEYASDLVTRLNTVTELGGRVAVTMGGTEADPTLSSVEAPAAWVVFRSQQNTAQPNRKFQDTRITFSVLLKLKYGAGETDFVDTQLNLIEKASQAVRGKGVPDQGNQLWGYDGCTLVDFTPSAVFYDLTFAASAVYSE